MEIKKLEKDEPIRPVSQDEIPPEFKKFDKPLGLEQHVYNILLLGVIGHSLSFYCLFYLIPFGYVSIKAFLFGVLYGYVTGIGTTVGSHRYWTHKTFKAKLPLQILLMLMQTAGLAYPIFKWAREHRVHHKYTDTNADPHSAARGLWFSHIGWLFVPKHPEVEEAHKIVDISDLVRDPVVRFQSKYYWELVSVVFFLIPMTLWKFFWPELTWQHILALNFLRFTVALHFTFLVNSVAHFWGGRPYDKYVSASENGWVAFLAAGEGWHNYHHSFPWDYKTSEMPYKINLSTMFIDFFAWIGWAYDLKTVSHKLLVDRINRTGDGNHPLYSKDAVANNNNNNDDDCKVEKAQEFCWGWGDERLSKEDMKLAEVKFPSKG